MVLLPVPICHLHKESATILKSTSPQLSTWSTAASLAAAPGGATPPQPPAACPPPLGSAPTPPPTTRPTTRGARSPASAPPRRRGPSPRRPPLLTQTARPCPETPAPLTRRAPRWSGPAWRRCSSRRRLFWARVGLFGGSGSRIGWIAPPGPLVGLALLWYHRRGFHCFHLPAWRWLRKQGCTCSALIKSYPLTGEVQWKTPSCAAC